MKVVMERNEINGSQSLQHVLIRDQHRAIWKEADRGESQ